MHVWRRAIVLAGIVAMPLASLSTSFVDAAEPLRVMTFNIRYGTAPDGDNEWPKRRGLLVEVIKAFDPDVLSVQEALDFQIVELEEQLDGYSHVGVGRDDAKKAGEYSAILFRRSRLKATDSGTFWFSDTPTVPGSMTWGNQFPRICSWAAFLDQAAADSEPSLFRVYNVHWDHQVEAANVKSGKMLAALIAVECDAAVPAVVTGDFNSGEASPAFKSLLGGPAELADTFRQLHPDATDVGTFHAFTGKGGADKIDAILVSRQWTTTEADVVRTAKPPVYPSDHFPVTATVVLKDAATVDKPAR